MLSLVNAFAGVILDLMAEGFLTEAALKVVPERALGAGSATAGAVLLMWSAAFLGGWAGWNW